MNADDLDTEIIEDDAPRVEQPPREDPITGPRPQHDPGAHFGEGTPPPPGGWGEDANGGGTLPPPPPRPDRTRPLRGEDRKIHERIEATYATVGLVVCAAAETRMQVLGHADPPGTPQDPARDRARIATWHMNQAGANTVKMATAAADSWVEVSREIPAVRTALERFQDGGTIMGLVMVHAMILVPYGVAAGWVPAVIGENITKMSDAVSGAAAEHGD